MDDSDCLVVAGHYFVNGICVRDNEDGKPCGRRLCDILCFGMANLHEAGIAHAGTLADYEAHQIEAEATRQRGAIADAMGWNDDSGDDDD
jgi:hypothetical protein